MRNLFAYFRVTFDKVDTYRLEDVEPEPKMVIYINVDSDTAFYEIEDCRADGNSSISVVYHNERMIRQKL